MATYLISQRAVVNAKSSFALLSVLTGERRNFSDDPKKRINLYQTLGIPSSATQGEIKKAYYDLTIKYHPDKNVNNEEAALKFREVSEAYEILGNYRSRKRYDRGLPISEVNKVIKHAVDHKSQYQEFFDSRSTKRDSSSDSRMKEINDLGAFSSRRSSEEAVNENSGEKASSANPHVLQIVFGIFVVVIVLCTRS